MKITRTFECMEMVNPHDTTFVKAIPKNSVAAMKRAIEDGYTSIEKDNVLHTFAMDVDQFIELAEIVK